MKAVDQRKTERLISILQQSAEWSGTFECAKIGFNSRSSPRYKKTLVNIRTFFRA